MSEPIKPELKTPLRCKRRDGSERKWFATRAEAEAFERDPANHYYHGDTPVYCECGGGGWHLQIGEHSTVYLMAASSSKAMNAGNN